MLATMISITQISQAPPSLKTSLMVGKQYQRPKMGMYGRCHRGKKISSFKNLIVELHTANSRYVNSIVYFFPVARSMSHIYHQKKEKKKKEEEEEIFQLRGNISSSFLQEK